MITRARARYFLNTRPMQLAQLILGVILIILAPLASPIPGPGGIILFAAGLTLVLRTSLWARRHYVRFKKWQPKAGRWTDWGLRRKSHQRREALRKEQERRDTPPPHCIERTDDPLPSAGMEGAPIDPTPASLTPTSLPGEVAKR